MDDYHAHPAINRSRLLRIAEKNPAWFKYCEENPPEPSHDLIFGQAFHTMVLEPAQFVRRFAIFPDCDRRTKDGKEEYEIWLSRLGGRQVITSSSYETLCQMDEALKASKDAMTLLEGIREQPIFWTDEGTGEECKCKPDVRRQLGEQHVIVDLKSCRDASTEGFSKQSVWQKYGYDVQAAMYIEGVYEECGINHQFVFVAVEKTPPYLVNIIEADDFLIDYGRKRFRELLDTYHECKETGNWWGYNGPSGEINKMNLPRWLEYELEG